MPAFNLLNRNLVVMTLLLGSWAFCPGTRAVTPAPDGGYAGANTAEGTQALQSLTTGIYNNGIGFQALYHNTTGSYNVGDGFRALFSNTTGRFNIAIGSGALYNDTTGLRNIGEGYAALFATTTGSGNVALGSTALYNNQTGNGNTATGDNALYHNTAGYNVANGSSALFNNTTGTNNVAVGTVALYSNIIGSFNTAVGNNALRNSVAAGSNTAVGSQALYNDTSGSSDNGFGTFSLFSNTTGGFNNAVGAFALSHNTTGNFNNAHGDEALFDNQIGSNNTAFGDLAGDFLTGSGNVCIGAGVDGVAGENDTTRIRNIGTTAYNTGMTVNVDANGKLGFVASSRRYKHDIEPMNKSSELLYSLKPVTFHYNGDIDPAHATMFGLIAEEVAKVDPDLAVRNANGEVEAIRSDSINAMLLNEFLKEHRKVEEHERLAKQQDARLGRQEATIAHQQKEIEALKAGLQKVSTEVQLSKSAPQTVANNSR
jgi:Chaperone of endosialidase